MTAQVGNMRSTGLKMARQIDAHLLEIVALWEQVIREGACDHGGYTAGLLWARKEIRGIEDRETESRKAVVLVACDPAPFWPQIPTRTEKHAQDPQQMMLSSSKYPAGGYGGIAQHLGGIGWYLV